MKFLFPKQPKFSEHFKDLYDCIKEVTDLFTEMDFRAGMEERWRKAEEIEHKADDIICRIIGELDKTFITPFDREDIYALAEEMDEIIDLSEKVFHNIYLYGIMEKEEFMDQFVGLITDACVILERLVDKCFADRVDTKNLEKRAIRIQKLEDKGDVVFRNALAHIFEKGKNDPLLVIKWKDIIQDMEEIIDTYNHVGRSIVKIMVKST
ncbi:MAG: DUF47 family protein [Patescibacteria group bacterium]|jgi:hypothetical protein